ncbi:MAG: replication factor C large subunit [archaeon]
MNESTPWTEKYRPNKLSEIAGHEKAIEIVLSYVKNFKKGAKPPLLHGPTGNGKTSLAIALANEFDYELVEMNASDFRTKNSIKEKLGHASGQQSLLQKKGKIILIDEIDGVHGNSDRGGLPAIYEIIKESSYPVLITANDAWKPKLSLLRKKCKTIKLEPVGIREATKKLMEIAGLENLKIGKDVVAEIARRSEGDLRAALNDLQCVTNGVKDVKFEDLDSMGVRDREKEITQVLMAIFKSKDSKFIMDTLFSFGKNPEEIFNWLAENIPNEYEKPDEIAKAYDHLSRADVFSRRIMRTQSWGLLKYYNDHIALGVSSAKHEKYSKFTKYAPPSIIMKMGRSKIARATRDAIAAKIGAELHCSKKRAIEQFPYLAMISKDSELFRLEPEERKFLLSA